MRISFLSSTRTMLRTEVRAGCPASKKFRVMEPVQSELMVNDPVRFHQRILRPHCALCSRKISPAVDGRFADVGGHCTCGKNQPTRHGESELATGVRLGTLMWLSWLPQSQSRKNTCLRLSERACRSSLSPEIHIPIAGHSRTPRARRQSEASDLYEIIQSSGCLCGKLSTPFIGSLCSAQLHASAADRTLRPLNRLSVLATPARLTWSFRLRRRHQVPGLSEQSSH
jgi:hypothetical protein